MNLQKLKYPIGYFEAPKTITAIQLNNWIEEISLLPSQLKIAVENLSPAQLDTPYRPEGWTVLQVVHHLPDSHLNAYIRFKLALTEDNPSIRPYHEDRWADLEAAKTTPIQAPLQLLEALHKQWVVLLQHCSSEDFKRTFFHPESKTSTSLAFNVGNYAWHGNHHLKQITDLKERMNW